MSQDPTEAQQAAMLLKLLQQQQGAQASKAPAGPTWQVVTEIVNVDSKTSTMNIESFNKTVNGKSFIVSDQYITNQIDSGADLLFKLEFSEKIKIETITFHCRPHSNNNSNDNNNANANDENNNDNNDASNDNNDNNENKDDSNDNNANAKPVCPTRLYFAKSSEALSNYFENKINSRDDELSDNEVNLIELKSSDLESGGGFVISFLKNRPKVYKGSGLRTKELVFGLTHEPVKLDEDDDDDTDYDMDGEEKYKEKSIYISGIVIKAAGQVSSKQDFEAQMKSIEKIKKGD